jgi:hypothetical protein
MYCRTCMSAIQCGLPGSNLNLLRVEMAYERSEGWCLLVVPILIAPCFHPTSSCSWRQLGVLSWWWSSGPPCHPALIVVVVPRCYCSPLSLSLSSLVLIFVLIPRHYHSPSSSGVPRPRVCSEGRGGSGCCLPEKNKKPLHSHLQ